MATKPAFAFLCATILAVALGASSAAEPSATGPGKAESWGEAVNGLRCRLEAEKAEAPQGAEAIFRLHLQFDPKGVDPQTNVLNRCWDAKRVKVGFTDAGTGKTFERLDNDGAVGLPICSWPEDFPELRGKPLEPVQLLIRLLSPKGEQLPPGTYAVAATYANDGSPEADSYKGPWKFWTGKLAAPPITVKITPAEAKETELVIPSALDLTCGENGVGFSWSTKAPRVLRLQVRPGYIVGTRYRRRAFYGDPKGEEAGGGMCSGVPRGGGGGKSFLDPARLKRVVAGDPLTLRADVEVFETSIPAGHMWQPEGGDFKVLWRGQVEGTLADAERANWEKPVDGLRNRLTLPKDAFALGEPIPATVELENVAERDVAIWWTYLQESLLTRAPDGKLLEVRLFDEPAGGRAQPLVIKKGQVRRIAKDIKDLFASVRLEAPQSFRLVWHGWLPCGDNDRDARSQLHVSNPVSVTVRPGAAPAKQGGP